MSYITGRAGSPEDCAERYEIFFPHGSYDVFPPRGVIGKSNDANIYMDEQQENVRSS